MVQVRDRQSVATNGETNGFKVVGQSTTRVDALEKVTGRALYAADVSPPGMLWGVFLRSPHPHALIKKIDTSKAEQLPGVLAVVTQESLATDQALVVEEEMHATRRVQTLFAQDKVHYEGEKVAAIAAMTKEIAEEAADLIEVEYEPLQGSGHVLDSIKESMPVINEGTGLLDAPADNPWGVTKLNNVAGEHHSVEGDVEAGFAESDRVYTHTFYIPRAHQTYIEPQVTVADVDAGGKVTVWTSTQGPFGVRSNLANSLRLPTNKINVHGMTIGGGFGAKFGGIVDTYTVLLAQKARRPVKMVYSRHEEFVDGRPAPGAHITIKTGVKNDGTIVARQAWALWDTGVGQGGGYATMRTKGVYNVEHFKFDAFDVNTCKPAPGAYRAPGAPQATFAGETQLNIIAEDLGIDPVEIRLLNMREGEQIAFKETLQAVADAAGWADRAPGPNEGWGVAVGEWTNGAGPGTAVVSVHDDGSAHVFSGLMDITGTDTAMAQIAAEVLTVPYDDVTTVRGDTDSAPFATGSGGSVVTFSMGNAVKRAAEDAKQRLLELAAEHLEAPLELLELRDGAVFVKEKPDESVSVAQLAQFALRERGGPVMGKGTFASQPSATTTAAQIGKVEVDPETGKVWIRELYNSLDAGKAINPMASEGQMEGGLVQGFAWGLMEAMQYDQDGHNLNPGLLDYRLPTTVDFPDIASVIVEEPTKNGPYGVKGIGEPPIAPGPAALASAVADATGQWITELPLVPERVYRATHES
jgi:CO/xanthine dehydrogenase Mo-binding subunit